MALVVLNLTLPAASMAAEPPPEAVDCAQVAALLKEENSRLSGELRRIQREIAALRADLDKPGVQEIFAGIGYILGLFGVAAFMAARRRKE
jgi:hypothetical protein